MTHPTRTSTSRLRTVFAWALLAISAIHLSQAPRASADPESPTGQSTSAGCRSNDKDNGVGMMAVLGLFIAGPVGMIALGSAAQRDSDRQNPRPSQSDCATDQTRKPASIASDTMDAPADPGATANGRAASAVSAR